MPNNLGHSLLNLNIAKPSKLKRDTKGFSDFYKEYMRSPEWRQKRKTIINRDLYRCRICGWQPKTHSTNNHLEVHHSTYERLGDEWDSDLITLCHHCHKEITKFLRKRRSRS